jgi:CRP/FNR family transcriptional regulator
MTSATVTQGPARAKQVPAGNPAASDSPASADMIRFPHPTGACGDCISRDCCMGAQLATATDSHALPLVKHNHTLGYREHLFREGDAPEAVYIVKSGSVKLYLIAEDGSEQVVGFYMPGDVLGLDALGTSTHRTSAIALECASFCVVPFSSLERAPWCQRSIYGLLSRELLRDHRTIALITKKDAEARMANFLVEMSERFSARGYSASSFNLSMKRNEIGSYLGLAVETVSRILTRFQDEGLLSVKRRQVLILDFPALQNLARCQGLPGVANTASAQVEVFSGQ